MGVTIRQVIVGSIPTIAAILGFLWFRRKKKDSALCSKESDEEEDESPPTQTHVTALRHVPNGDVPSARPRATMAVVEDAIFATPVHTESPTVPPPVEAAGQRSIEEQIESQILLSSHPLSAVPTSTMAPPEVRVDDRCERSESGPLQESVAEEAKTQDTIAAECSSELESKEDTTTTKATTAETEPEPVTEEVVEASVEALVESTAWNLSSPPPQQTPDECIDAFVSEVHISSTSSSQEKVAPTTAKSTTADENANVERAATATMTTTTPPTTATPTSRDRKSKTKAGREAVRDKAGLTNGDVLVNGQDLHVAGGGDADRKRMLSSTEEESGIGSLDSGSRHQPSTVAVSGDSEQSVLDAGDAQSEVSSDSGRGASGVETPTATSPSELVDYVVFEFDFPTDCCGRLIGKMGKNINSVKNKTGAEIVLRRKPFSHDYQTCSVEGSASQVAAALEQIKRRFPPNQDITYKQTNLTDGSPVLTPGIMQLALPEGVSVDVVVSSVVNANHVFIQQPTHPTFSSLENLNYCMNVCYTQDNAVPLLPRPIEAGVICAAPVFSGWYRAQVVDFYPDSDECYIKYTDYGGYMVVPAASLRQIRKDFATLPFQAVECYLSNVVPLQDGQDFGVEAAVHLQNLVQGQMLQAQIVCVEENGVPYIELYHTRGLQTAFINRELVEAGVARWLETQA